MKAENAQLYGSSDVDFSLVGAPLYGDDVPPATSPGPNAPGVLVTVMDFDKHYPRDTPVLLVGTIANADARLGEPDDGTIQVSSDGAGFGMLVHEITVEGFNGRWSQWGIVADGSGTFCAKLVR